MFGEARAAAYRRFWTPMSPMRTCSRGYCRSRTMRCFPNPRSRLHRRVDEAALKRSRDSLSRGGRNPRRQRRRLVSARTSQHRAAYPVDLVDTTGAGDVFHGAYAWRSAAASRLRRDVVCLGRRGAQMHAGGRPLRNPVTRRLSRVQRTIYENDRKEHVVWRGWLMRTDISAWSRSISGRRCSRRSRRQEDKPGSGRHTPTSPPPSACWSRHCRRIAVRCCSIRISRYRRGCATWG